MERYRNFFADNARWEGFRFRPGDIVITTPPKCGTTWMQMLCALLIFQNPRLPRPLDQLSPWLEHRIQRANAVFAVFEGQQHRRFIKSHTPLDGLPIEPDVTYVCVGRDPRDAFVSATNHLANFRGDVAAGMTITAEGLDDVSQLLPNTSLPPGDPDELLRWWLDDDTPPTSVMGTLRSTLHHLDTGWTPPSGANVALFHYNDLQNDLDGQMRRLAAILDIGVPTHRWQELLAAASFGAMRARADELVGTELWNDASRFFNRGTSGQWRDLLNDRDLHHYQERVAHLVDGDLAAWIHSGWHRQTDHAAGDRPPVGDR